MFASSYCKLTINNQSFLECDCINIIQSRPRPASRRGQVLDFMSLPRLQICAASQASAEPRSALSTTRKVPLQRKSTNFFRIKTQLEAFTSLSSLYNNTLSLHHRCRDDGSVKNQNGMCCNPSPCCYHSFSKMNIRVAPIGLKSCRLHCPKPNGPPDRKPIYPLHCCLRSFQALR